MRTWRTTFQDKFLFSDKIWMDRNHPKSADNSHRHIAYRNKRFVCTLHFPYHGRFISFRFLCCPRATVSENLPFVCKMSRHIIIHFWFIQSHSLAICYFIGDSKESAEFLGICIFWMRVNSSSIFPVSGTVRSCWLGAKIRRRIFWWEFICRSLPRLVLTRPVKYLKLIDKNINAMVKLCSINWIITWVSLLSSFSVNHFVAEFTDIVIVFCKCLFLQTFSIQCLVILLSFAWLWRQIKHRFQMRTLIRLQIAGNNLSLC